MVTKAEEDATEVIKDYSIDFAKEQAALKALEHVAEKGGGVPLARSLSWSGVVYSGSFRSTRR